MKKDTLYTANKYNKSIISPKINLLQEGGFGLNGGKPLFDVSLSNKYYSSAPYINWSNSADRAKAAGYLSGLTGSSTESGDIFEGLKGLGSVGTAVGNFAGKAIAGNYTTNNSGLVNGIFSALKTVTKDPALNLELGVMEGLYNRTYGSDMNDEGIANIESGIASTRNSASGLASAGSTEDFISRASNVNIGNTFTQEQVGKDGWLAHKAKDKYNDLLAQQEAADAYARNAMATGAQRVDKLNDDNIMANFAANGGFLDLISNNNMGPSIDYGFMFDYLLNRKKQTEAKQNSTATVFKNGGKIHIKPENRGKLTALKKRTGKTEAELYKNGGKAVRKMITFARNARKWKHADGGYLLEPFFNSSTWANPIPDVTTPMELPKGGTYGGGHFGGSGTSSPFGYPDTQFEEVRDTIWVPVTQDFNTAFRNARKAGLDEFTFDGKKYSTEIGDNPNNYKAGKKRTESFLVPIERKKKQVKKHDLGGPLVWNGDNMFALGGDYQTNGSDFTTGLRHIDAGGSHEMNPYDGVQQGVDGEGVPNLVEEGEVVFNDYVYSNRIELDEQAKARFHFPKKKDITYADAAKKLERESKERPNDPISKAALKAQLSDLADEQERQKKEMEAERAREQFESLSPDEQVAVMEQVAQAEQAQAAQQQAVAAQQQEQQSMQEPSPEQAAMMQQQTMADGSEAAIGMQPQMAMGGRLYAPGGATGLRRYSPYKNGSDGYSTPTGFKVDKDSRAYDYTNEYWDLVSRLGANDVRKWAAAHPDDPSLQSFLAKGNKLEDLTDDQWKKGALDGVYGFMHHAADELLKDPSNSINAADELLKAPVSVPEESSGSVVAETPQGPVYYLENGANGYIPIKADDINDDLEEITEFPVGYSNVNTKFYRRKAKAAEDTKNNNSLNTEVKPAYRNETNYSLYTPLIDAALMTAGVGKPDFTELDNIMNRVDSQAYLADWKPIGTYVPYKPFDVWSQRNRNAANLASTIRAINNTVNPNKQASTVAALNTALNADGQLGIQAEQTNYNNLLQSAGFNKDTEKYNSTAFGQNSQFNTNALNQHNQFRGNLATNIALNKLQNKADYEGNWYKIAGNFDERLAQWEKWKRDYNTATDTLFSRGAGMSEETPVTRGRIKKTTGVKRANGGKIKRRKRGLTI